LRSAEDVARYLVTLALADQRDAIEVLRLYFVENASPSEIEARLNVARSRVQGYVQRVREKVGSQRAHTLLRQLLPKLKSVAPIANGRRCVLCSEPVVNMPLTVHIILFHKDYVDRIVRDILDGGGKG
jgi:DNA-binding CsgD family transcriptional regulator